MNILISRIYIFNLKEERCQNPTFLLSLGQRESKYFFVLTAKNLSHSFQLCKLPESSYLSSKNKICLLKPKPVSYSHVLQPTLVFYSPVLQPTLVSYSPVLQPTLVSYCPILQPTLVSYSAVLQPTLVSYTPVLQPTLVPTPSTPTNHCILLHRIQTYPDILIPVLQPTLVFYSPALQSTLVSYSLNSSLP